LRGSLVLTAREWHDLHAAEYDASYEDMKWKEIYDHVTWDKTIQPYLPDDRGALILDAGGGTGKWTIPIAGLGYHVTLTDISEGMLRVAERKLEKANLLANVRIIAADVTEMDMLEGGSFDFVLCEGDPLSYCSDPRKGIGELVRVAKEGAIIVASVDNLYSRLMWSIRQGLLDQALKLLEDQWAAGEFPMYFFKPCELIQRFRETGCKVEKIVGKNMFSGGLGEDRLRDPDTFGRILKLELEYCDDPYIIGCAGHMAVVCRKQGH